jgi:hypothetical protein
MSNQAIYSKIIFSVAGDAIIVIMLGQAISYYRNSLQQ